MAREVDREERLLRGERRGVPGVGVESGPVEEGDTRRVRAETQSAQAPSIREGESQSLDRGHGNAQRVGLCGKIAELSDVDRHVDILRPFPAGSEMREQCDN